MAEVRDADARPRFDMERIAPDLLSETDPIEGEILDLHRARYRFAGHFARDCRVLDLACGVGYGSAMLADAGASFVQGVDLSEAAIQCAKANYSRPGVEFERADAFEYVPRIPFDVVVSLETIEHVSDPVGLIRRLVSMVTPGGLLIGSVPITLSSDINPYHLHDFTASQFRSMFLDSGLEIVEELEQIQRYSLLGIMRLRRTSNREYAFRRKLLRYYATHPLQAVRRGMTTFVHGFRNKYLLLAGLRR